VLTFLIRRTLASVLVMFVVCTVTFSLLYAAPGGPSILADPKLSVQERAAIEQRLGLDQPVVVQYARWMNRVVRGDMGHSFLYQTPTVSTVLSRLPETAILAGSALLISLLIGIPIGVLSAIRGGWVDRALGAATFGLMAVPVFWLGIMLILLFAVTWQLLPAGGTHTVGAPNSIADRLRHLILPALVLAAAGTAELVRYTRSSVRSALGEIFVKSARARGLPERRVHWRHVLRNAVAPVATVVGLQLPRLIGGAAITETVFSWPGMGRLGIEAALARDYPLVMGVTVFVSAAVLAASLIVDVAYAVIDPRVVRT
jgi:peptide/nickel transport system permease protein